MYKYSLYVQCVREVQNKANSPVYARGRALLSCSSWPVKPNVVATASRAGTSSRRLESLTRTRYPITPAI